MLWNNFSLLSQPQCLLRNFNMNHQTSCQNNISNFELDAQHFSLPPGEDSRNLVCLRKWTFYWCGSSCITFTWCLCTPFQPKACSYIAHVTFDWRIRKAGIVLIIPDMIVLCRFFPSSRTLVRELCPHWSPTVDSTETGSEDITMLSA